MSEIFQLKPLGAFLLGMGLWEILKVRRVSESCESRLQKKQNSSRQELIEQEDTVSSCVKGNIRLDIRKKVLDIRKKLDIRKE